MAITVNRGNDTDIFHCKLRPSVFMKLHSTVNDEPIKWYNEYICSKLHLFPATGENTSVISGQREPREREGHSSKHPLNFSLKRALVSFV